MVGGSRRCGRIGLRFRKPLFTRGRVCRSDCSHTLHLTRQVGHLLRCPLIVEPFALAPWDSMLLAIYYMAYKPAFPIPRLYADCFAPSALIILILRGPFAARPPDWLIYHLVPILSECYWIAL